MDNQGIKNIIVDALNEYTKSEGVPFKGVIYFNPKDYLTILGVTDLVSIDEDSNKTIFGLQFISMSDEDIAWTGIEFTGWDQKHPELLQFIENIKFRELLYSPDSKKEKEIKSRVLKSIPDLVGSLLYYDRKEDEDLSVEDIESVLSESFIKTMTETFKLELMKNVTN